MDQHKFFVDGAAETIRKCVLSLLEFLQLQLSITKIEAHQTVLHELDRVCKQFKIGQTEDVKDQRNVLGLIEKFQPKEIPSIESVSEIILQI